MFILKGTIQINSDTIAKMKSSSSVFWNKKDCFPILQHKIFIGATVFTQKSLICVSFLISYWL